VQNSISNCITPRLRFEFQQEQSFLLFGVNFSPFVTPLIKHSLYFPLCFDARFCISYNVLLVVRILGLLCTGNGHLGVFLALNRLSPSNFDILAQLNWI